MGRRGGEPHEPEHSVTEHQFGSEFDDQIMLKVKETPTTEDRGTMRDNPTEQPLLSDIERMMASIAKLESEEKAADQRSETMLTRALAVEEMDDPTKCEERALAKREAEEMQRLAERAKLAERLRTRERELLASREKQLQDSARIRRLQKEEREAQEAAGVAAREKQTADGDPREELRAIKEKLRRSEEDRREFAEKQERDMEIAKTARRAKPQADQHQVPRTPPMASPVEPRAKRPREIFDELVSILPKDLKTDEVTSLKERVYEALYHGFTLERPMKQKLSAIDSGDRFKEVIAKEKPDWSTSRNLRISGYTTKTKKSPMSGGYQTKIPRKNAQW